MRQLPIFRFAAICLAVLLSLVLGLPAHAQQAAGSAAGGVLAEQRPVIEGFVARAAELERRLTANAGDDARLVEIRIDLEELGRALLAASVAFRPRLAEINTRLEQIGAAPAEGQPAEPQQLADERAALIQEKAEINAVLGEAETLSLRISRLVEQVAGMRRELFANQLYKRYDITAALNARVLGELQMESRRLYERITSWLRFITQFKLNSVLVALFFSLAAAAVLMIGGRRAFDGLIVADPEVTEPSYLSRLSVAFWSTLLPSAALAVFLGVTYYLFNYFNILRADISELMVTLFNVIVTVFFVNRLAHAAFSPSLPHWRLVPVESGAARTLYRLVWLTAVITGIDFVLARASTVMSSPLSLTIAQSLLATVIVGALVIAISLVKPFRDADGRPKPWNVVLRWAMRLIGAVTIVSAILGYIGFARFVSQQLVITGAILATMYIGFLSARALSDFGAFTQTAFGRRLDARFQFAESTEDQIGLAVGIAINLLVLIVGVPLILLQWGFQWGDIALWAGGILREVRIGSFSFSIVGILTGIFVFIVGYSVTRWFQGWLDGSVMSRGKVDAGVRNSIRTVVGYAGLAVAVLVGISAAGVNLSSLALIAGGLSLGIGFGLQNIVQNFVSGLILLAERPFKVGDWIVAGPVSGTVKKISVRATEIETFQRQTVILPNSELINAAVGNWTHKNKLGRTDVKVNVAYGADVRRVQAVLLQVLQANPLVLRNPEPAVMFTNIGDLGLEFECRAFIADITGGLGVQNALRMSIYETLPAEGIRMTFAPRAVFPDAPPATLSDDPAPAESESDPGSPPAAAPGDAASRPDPRANALRPGPRRKADPE